MLDRRIATLSPETCASIARILKHPVTRASLDGVTTQYRTDDRMALFNEAVIGAAGPAAELRLHPCPQSDCLPLWDGVWKGDREKVERIPIADRRAVARQARELVKQNWHAIGKVAAALLDKDVLTESELDALIADG